MADSRNIVITLKMQHEYISSDSGSNESGEDRGKASINKLLRPTKTRGKEVLAKNVILNQAYQYAKASIKQAVEYQLNVYFSLTENYTAQQDMNNALTSIGKVTGFGASIMTGATAGSVVPGAGTVVGAIAAAVAYAGNEAIQTYQRFNQQERTLAGMNVQSSFQLTRMGLIDGGRGSSN